MSRWVWTSVAEANWESDLARTCSADYHAKYHANTTKYHANTTKYHANTTKYHANTTKYHQIPPNAVAIEIAPRCLLQSVLRRSLAATTSMTAVMKAKHENNLELLLSAIGRIYEAGVPVCVRNLYPQAPYPVPSGTLVKWDHAIDWYHITTAEATQSGSGGVGSSCTFTYDPFAPDSQDAFLLDHVIDGRILFPLTAHLVMACKAMCKVNRLDFMKTHVIIEEVSVFRPSIVSKAVKFDVVICPGQGSFEIMEEDSLNACGKISVVEDSKPFFYDSCGEVHDSNCERVELETADVYKKFLLRGYEYGPNFRGIYRACNSGFQGALYWTGLPVRLRYIRIDPERHLKCIEEIDDGQVIPLRNDFNTNGVFSGGVETSDLIAQTVPRRLHASGKCIWRRSSSSTTSTSTASKTTRKRQRV